MVITEFFQQSVGKWFSQRTTHNLVTNQSSSGKSDLWIDLLPADEPTVVSLCQQAGDDVATIQTAFRVRWDGDFGAKPDKGSTLIVAIAFPSSSTEGRLLSQSGASIMQTRYNLGEDEVLTLITEQESFHAEERIWYASPSLRFRTSTVKHTDGFSMASFCSEIRMGGAKPAASQQATAQA